MKNKTLLLTFIMILLSPIKVFAVEGFKLSNSTIDIYVGETKTILVSSDVAVGKLNVSSSNNGVASVNINSIFIQTVGSSQSINITGNSVGVAIVSVVATSEFATMDEEILTGQTKTLTINVKEKEQAPVQQPQTQTQPQQPQTPTVTTPTAPKNTDATLKNIELSEGNIEFSNDKDTYDLTVDYSVSSIEINGVLNDNKASVKIEGDTNLKEGDNVIKLVVTAEDGKATKTYTLNIKRENKVLSKNSKIKKLTINNYDINFNNNKKSYDLIIGNEDNLTFNVELEDEFAKYEIVGNKKLKNKSVIKVIVTAEDKSSTVYSINIIKEKNKTKELSIALICSIISSIIVFGLLIFIIIRLKNKKLLKDIFTFKKK